MENFLNNYLAKRKQSKGKVDIVDVIGMAVGISIILSFPLGLCEIVGLKIPTVIEVIILFPVIFATFCLGIGVFLYALKYAAIFYLKFFLSDWMEENFPLFIVIFSVFILCVALFIGLTK